MGSFHKYDSWGWHKALTYDVNPVVTEEVEQQGGEDEASGGIADQEKEEERK